MALPWLQIWVSFTAHIGGVPGEEKLQTNEYPIMPLVPQVPWVLLSSKQTSKKTE